MEAGNISNKSFKNWSIVVGSFAICEKFIDIQLIEGLRDYVTEMMVACVS